MLQQIVIGLALVVATTLVHAAATILALGALRWNRARRWSVRHLPRKVRLVTAVVLMMFLASLVEIAIWAAFYVESRALPDLGTAAYFSAVTFTTLGYGDVTLDASWRLLGALEGANGVILLGWGTALVFAAVREAVVEDERPDDCLGM